MRELFLAIGAAALFSIAGFVAAQTAQTTTTLVQTSVDNPTATATQPDPGTKMRLAAMDTSAAAFRKLDTDNDGRISALEAAENPRVAAAFTMADKDKDGYLSKEEFEAMSSSTANAQDVDASTPSADRVTAPSGDQPATAPNDPRPTSTSSAPRTIPRPKH
jgi:cell division protein FtsN